MIKFEILESLNFRGGNHYCDVYADTPSEVVEALKDAWYGSGISRHGGELFVEAHLSDADGNEVQIFFGNCNFDKRDRLYFNFSNFNNDEDYEPWYSFGMFSVGGTKSLEDVLKALFDLDSPDRVLGSYIFKVGQKFDTLPEEEKLDFDLNVFANILDFGKNQGKLLELVEWIFSKNGLKQLDHFPFCIDMENPEILALGNAPNSETLEQFIKQYKKDLDRKSVV
jgi:hypothetical protein